MRKFEDEKHTGSRYHRTVLIKHKQGEKNKMKTDPKDPRFEEIPYPEYVLRILCVILSSSEDGSRVQLPTRHRQRYDDPSPSGERQSASIQPINLISLIFGKSTRTVKALSARFNKGGFRRYRNKSDEKS